MVWQECVKSGEGATRAEPQEKSRMGVVPEVRASIGAPFPGELRAAGILLHLTSLPSKFGVGDFGPPAFDWIDRLAEAKQSWWQILPLSAPGYGNSPFEPLSTFSLNPVLISPERLVEEELLQVADLSGGPTSAESVEYEQVVPFKERLIDVAWERFRQGSRQDLRPVFETFCHEHAGWLDDYALFCALKHRYGDARFLDWPVGDRRREDAAVHYARQELAEVLDRLRFGQFLLDRQATALKAYAWKRGVRLIGDLPFFVALDSCDVWARPELFLLDREGRPRFLSGVPPDYFSRSGQLWGTPLYDWNIHRETGYDWWLRRLRWLLSYVDLIRLDHFRAFAAAWHVPSGAATAEQGEWLPGPGADFFGAARQALGGLPLIAEDLGLLTPDVYELRDQFRLPGMRVLQFAFDSDENNPFLPQNYIANTVVYTGTHDNDTTRGWFDSLPADQQGKVLSHLDRDASDEGGIAWDLIRLASTSRAALAMIPLQDVLNLPASARMNVPGSTAGNWRWRATEPMLCDPAFLELRALTEETGRAGCASSSDGHAGGTAPSAPPPPRV